MVGIWLAGSSVPAPAFPKLGIAIHLAIGGLLSCRGKIDGKRNPIRTAAVVTWITGEEVCGRGAPLTTTVTPRSSIFVAEPSRAGHVRSGHCSRITPPATLARLAETHACASF